MALICHQEKRSEQSLRDLTLPQSMLSLVGSPERLRFLNSNHCCGPSRAVFMELPNPLALSLYGTYQQRELANRFLRLPGIALLGSSLLRPVYVCPGKQRTHLSLSLLPFELQPGGLPAGVHLSAVVSAPFPCTGPPPLCSSRSSSGDISSTEDFPFRLFDPTEWDQSLSVPLQRHSTFYSMVRLREHLPSLPGEPRELLEL